MKSYIPYIITLILAMSVAEASAQLKESVEVEGQYQKEILHPDKLGRLPGRMRLTPPDVDLPYSFTGTPADFVPAGSPIPATSFGASRSNVSPRGYLNLEMGSWLNTGLKAGYAIFDKPDTSFNIWLRHNSTSLWKPFSDFGVDSRRFNYQEAIGIDWSHRIAGVGRIDAGARYHAGYFNYYGLPEHPESSVAPVVFSKFPTQTINDISARVAIGDISPYYARNHWNVALATRHFAFRTATRETSLNLTGDYERLLSSDPADISRPTAALGLSGDLQWLLYGSHKGTESPDAYGNLRLSPYYRWTNSRFGMRLGVNLDLTFNADNANPADVTGHYSLFHIAPDVRFDYINPYFTAWIHATGGQQLQTLATIADRNLYCLPALQSTTPVYVPLDVQFGFRLKPFGGFEIEGRFGYKISKNIIGGGWTIPLMYQSPGGLISQVQAAATDIPTFGLGQARYNLKGFYAGAKVAYQLSDVLNVEADLEYAPQSDEHGIFNGDDRPRWILTPGFELNPLKPLAIGVKYEYRGVRSVWSPVITKDENASDTRAQQGGTSVGPGINPPSPSVPTSSAKESLKPVGLRLPDITRLNAHVSYTFSNLKGINSITLGIYARNLLNQRETLLPGLPSEGLTISGSIQLLF